MAEESKKPPLVRRAALAGAVLAVFCQFLPPDHRVLCASVVKLASLTCGAGG